MEFTGVGMKEMDDWKCPEVIKMMKWTAIGKNGMKMEN